MQTAAKSIFIFQKTLYTWFDNSGNKIKYYIFESWEYVVIIFPRCLLWSMCLPKTVQNRISFAPWCSSLPVCGLTVHLEVPVLKQGPWRFAEGHPGFRSSCFAAVWDSLHPFFRLPCRRNFLGTPLRSNLNSTDLRPDPRCSQTQSSHWVEGSPEHS